MAASVVRNTVLKRQLEASVTRWKEFLQKVEEVSSIEELLVSDNEVLRRLGKRLLKDKSHLSE